MATILFAWELGGNLGHVTRLRPLAEAFLRQGHRVIVAVRELHSAAAAFRGTDIVVVQAPFKTCRPVRGIQQPAAYCHLLHNIGFSSPASLGPLFDAWRNLFKLVRPELIVFDHSPTALLASRGLKARRVIYGDGFCCPPPTDPLPALRPWMKSDRNKLISDERRTLNVVNSVLLARKLAPLDCLRDLYRDVEQTHLCTFSELDHFGARGNSNYWGPWSHSYGTPPKWPRGTNPRVFAYLKRSRGLPGLLAELKRLELPSIVVGSWVNDRVRRRFSCPTLCLENKPLAMKRTASECDLAVLNATHGSTASLLLAGKPILQLPIYLEQRLVAERLLKLGAGCSANRDEPSEITQGLQQLLESDEMTVQAMAFSKRYQNVDHSARRRQLVNEVLQLVA